MLQSDTDLPLQFVISLPVCLSLRQHCPGSDLHADNFDIACRCRGQELTAGEHSLDFPVLIGELELREAIYYF